MKQAQEKDMSFLDHLEELRFRIMRSIMAILVFAIAAFIAKDFIFDQIIFAPRRLDFLSFRMWCKLGDWAGMGDKLCVKEISYRMQSTTMLGQFTSHIMVSVIAGFILAFPYVFMQIWGFIKPGLKATEQKVVRGVTFFTSILFFSGVLFGYFMIVPLSLQFLGSYKVGDDVETITTINSYMKLVVSITLSTGLVFQLPVIVYFLSRIGLVTPKLLRQFRKHALVAVLILAAIITPPDLTSQILVAFPVLILYEVSILISARVNRQRRAAENQ